MHRQFIPTGLGNIWEKNLMVQWASRDRYEAKRRPRFKPVVPSNWEAALADVPASRIPSQKHPRTLELTHMR
jgi:hypothetical protein